MTRQQTVRRARALRRNIKWLRGTFFAQPPSTPQEELLLGLLKDFERVLAEILRAANRGEWARANQLIRAFDEAHRDFVNDVIKPARRRLAEES